MTSRKSFSGSGKRSANRARARSRSDAQPDVAEHVPHEAPRGPHLKPVEVVVERVLSSGTSRPRSARTRNPASISASSTDVARLEPLVPRSGLGVRGCEHLAGHDGLDQLAPGLLVGVDAVGPRREADPAAHPQDARPMSNSAVSTLLKCASTNEPSTASNRPGPNGRSIACGGRDRHLRSLTASDLEHADRLVDAHDDARRGRPRPAPRRRCRVPTSSTRSPSATPVISTRSRATSVSRARVHAFVGLGHVVVGPPVAHAQQPICRRCERCGRVPVRG